MNWNLYINFFAAMLAIVNPVGIWPLWSSMTKDYGPKRQVRRKIAWLVTITSFAVLVVFLVSGKYLLQFFSIDLEVFKIAGGVLLLYTGISMVQGTATQIQVEEEESGSFMEKAKQRFRKILVPLVIPALAGPGSITTVVLYSTNAESFVDYAALAGVLLIAFFVLYAVFTHSSLLENKVDDIVFTVFTRVFGIIVTAIAIQFVVEGLGEIFPNWLEGASALEEGSNSNTP